MSDTEGVRDPVHDWIALSESEWRAVDTAVFQRLRRIRQLAMTYLVYPGTTHTRFEHSLGVRHVAGRICTRLEQTAPELFPEERKTAVLNAALLHDVGHGPFSHVSEQVLDEVAGVRKVHEKISVTIARTDENLRGALGGAECDAAADLIEGVGGRSVYRDIVSGETDADKLDYLPRDSYFAGVAYGKCDLTRLIDTVEVLGDPAAQTYLGFRAAGIFAVEGLVLARHHMFRQVYAHKTRLATDIMIIRALMAAIEEDVLPRDAYTVPVADGQAVPTKEFVDAFLNQTDESVLEAMLSAQEGLVCRDLAERLVSRRLLRQTVSVPLHRPTERLDRRQLAAILDAEQFTREKINELEMELANELGFGDTPYLVALYLDRRANPTYRLPGSRIDEKQIVLELDGGIVYLEDESEIFQPMKVEEQSFLFLYTPPMDDAGNDRAKELLWEILARP
jgi:uncharacterized protein